MAGELRMETVLQLINRYRIGISASNPPLHRICNSAQPPTKF